MKAHAKTMYEQINANRNTETNNKKILHEKRGVTTAKKCRG